MNLIRLQTLVSRVVVAGVLLHAVAGDVWAQAPANLPPAESGSRNWMVAAGILVVVCSVGFVNAKRSHLK